MLKRTQKRTNDQINVFARSGFTFIEGNEGWVAVHVPTNLTSSVGTLWEVLYWAEGFYDALNR